MVFGTTDLAQSAKQEMDTPRIKTKRRILGIKETSYFYVNIQEPLLQQL